jgi:hypothetical protein
VSNILNIRVFRVKDKTVTDDFERAMEEMGDEEEKPAEME